MDKIEKYLPPRSNSFDANVKSALRGVFFKFFTPITNKRKDNIRDLDSINFPMNQFKISKKYFKRIKKKLSSINEKENKEKVEEKEKADLKPEESKKELKKQKSEIPEDMPNINDPNWKDCMIRIDVNSRGMEKANLRFLSQGQYKLQERSLEKYAAIRNCILNEEGLDDLNISGSRQYTEAQSIEIVKTIKEIAPGKKIFFFDLREESHGFINGIPVSWYKYHNFSNLGIKTEDILAEEEQKLRDTMDTEIVAWNIKNYSKLEMKVTENKTEKELVESLGCNYVRYTITDNGFPEPKFIDDFIELIKREGKDNIWMHFHCSAGLGRTGIFMSLTDMIKNPHIDFYDIVNRQCLLGATNLMQKLQEDSWKSSLIKHRKKMTKALYNYVQENIKSNFAVPWSEWIKIPENTKKKIKKSTSFDY